MIIKVLLKLNTQKPRRERYCLQAKCVHVIQENHFFNNKNNFNPIKIHSTVEEYPQSRPMRNKYFPEKQCFPLQQQRNREEFSHEKFACTHTRTERHAGINASNATMEYRVNCIAAAFAPRAAARSLRLLSFIRRRYIRPSRNP